MIVKIVGASGVGKRTFINACCFGFWEGTLDSGEFDHNGTRINMTIAPGDNIGSVIIVMCDVNRMETFIEAKALCEKALETNHIGNVILLIGKWDQPVNIPERITINDECSKLVLKHGGLRSYIVSSKNMMNVGNILNEIASYDS